MSTLKDLITADIDNVFMNLDEFADKHRVDNAVIQCILEDATINAVNDLRFLSEATYRLYARESDLPRRRNPGQVIHIDGVGYTIVTWKVEMGMVIAELSHEEVY